ncbi:Nuclear transport factor 2, eukaryote,NTF2-like domain [Cinara cedri]|uniref:Nuclear transport factor 2, eukaryote,NTF2-like domain n=1 Tax=Cinara cedri TaxID=506608 RepID=A0A5E4N6V7_9HEMI|nr:Nuclear transport factor 2, eukaryote,NTF2-like domain [Cinara cedri]
MNNDAYHEVTAIKTSISIETSATEAGNRFAQLYNATLSTKPKNACLFYDEFCDYRTIYEDGTCVIAKNWKEINSTLLSSTNLSDIFFRSITSEPRDGSLDKLLITVTGARFKHVFIANRRPKQGLRYAIVRSVKQYIPLNQPTQVTTFNVGDSIAENTNDHESEQKNQENISDGIVNYVHPSRNAVMNNNQSTITTVKNLPKTILKQVTGSTEIATTTKLSLDTMNNDAYHEITAIKTSISFGTSATEAGNRFAQLYNATLSTKPKNAYLFYDEFCDYRTIYEDGTCVIAKNWKEINSTLLSSTNLSDIFFRSITSEPRDGSLDKLLITVTGARFKHVFIANRRPKRGLRYAIVRSMKQYFPTDHPTQVKAFAAGDNIAQNTYNQETAGKKQGNISDDITEYKKPSFNAVNINTYNAITTVENSPKGILKRVTRSTEIASTSNPTHDTVINDANREITVKNPPKGILNRVSSSTEIATTSRPARDTVNNDAKQEITANNNSNDVMTSATEVGFKFAQRYYATLSTKKDLAYLFYEEHGEYQTIYEDGTSVLAKNWEEINSVIWSPVTFSDIFVRSITTEFYGESLENLLITVIGIRFKHIFFADYRPNRELNYVIVKSVKQYFPADHPTQVKTFAAGDNIAQNTDNQETAGKKQRYISDVIAENKKPSFNAVNINTYNAITTVKTPPKGILKRVTRSTEIASTSKPSRDTVNNDANREITVKNPPKGILKRVTRSTEIASTSKPSSDTVINNANREITVKNPPKGILKRVTRSTEIATTSKPSRDTVINDTNHEITANNNSIGVMMSATEAGFNFAQRYYATLNTEKDLTYLYYEELGDYRTIYEDGTSVLAKNWKEINSVILSPSTFSDIIVTSITSEPYGGSLEHLLITVTGIRFKHVFIAHYRPNRELFYVIVNSVMQYFPADHLMQIENSTAGDVYADNTNIHEPV